MIVLYAVAFLCVLVGIAYFASTGNYKMPIVWIEKQMENILDWMAFLLIFLAVLGAFASVFLGSGVIGFFAAVGCFSGAVSIIFCKMILVGVRGKTSSGETVTTND